MECVIPAAGRGTRMADIRGETPKELLRIGERSLLEWAMREAADAGASAICLILTAEKERKAVEVLKNFSGPPIIVRHQEGPDGVAHAASLFRDRLTDAFWLSMPDNLFLGERPALSQLREVHERTGASVLGLLRAEQAEAGGSAPRGRVRLSPEGRVLTLPSKGTAAEPSVGGWAVCGRQLVTPDFFSIYDRIFSEQATGERDDVPILQEMVRAGTLCGCPLRGRVYDCGRPPGYEKARERIEGI